MDIYTYSEARQRLSMVLDGAETTGKVLIRRRDGRVFALVPETQPRSPLDIPSVDARISTDEVVALVREGRRRTKGGTRG